MRSAAAGEHRTGEECLDDKASDVRSLPETGDRCAVKRSLVRNGPEVGCCVPFHPLSRAKVLGPP